MEPFASSRPAAPPQGGLAGARLVASCTILSLLLSVFCFSPRLWLMTRYLPGTFQWDRAHTFLLQCAQPFRRDIETAMLWRLLPPLVCHAVGLRGTSALVFPWLGVLACTGYVALLHTRRCPKRSFVFGGTLLFATTSAVLVPVGWFGINDAWCWLGLLVFTFGESQLARGAAGFFCPWIDERFLIGLPLALLVRRADTEAPWTGREALAASAWLPYALVRVAVSLGSATAGRTLGFLHSAFGTAALLVPWAQLAWWMGLRAAWIPIAYAVVKRPPWLGVAAALTLIACLILASDLSRSAAILTPLAVGGGFLFLRNHPAAAPRTMLTLGIANLLIPAAHVVYTKFDPINNILIELLRLRHTP